MSTIQLQPAGLLRHVYKGALRGDFGMISRQKVKSRLEHVWHREISRRHVGSARRRRRRLPEAQNKAIRQARVGRVFDERDLRKRLSSI